MPLPVIENGCGGAERILLCVCVLQVPRLTFYQMGRTEKSRMCLSDSGIDFVGFLLKGDLQKCGLFLIASLRFLSGSNKMTLKEFFQRKPKAGLEPRPAFGVFWKFFSLVFCPDFKITPRASNTDE